jgi:hypothetical protein
MKNAASRRAARLAALALSAAALAACSDGSGPNQHGSPTHVEIVVNSVDNSVTLLTADSTGAEARTVGLGSVQASPVGVAARAGVAVIPEGIYPFAAVVNLRAGTVHQVALPSGSGATGVAFLNDSIAIVGNPEKGTVSPINVAHDSVWPQVTVGTYPQAVVPGNNGNVYVLNGNLVQFSPAGPGSVTVINSSAHAAGTIALTGINPQAGVVKNGKLYVINAGHYGSGDGSLSIVNLSTGREESNVTGFGEFPGSIDVGPDGNVYVGVYGVGILVWNPQTRTFVRGLNNPLKPGDSPPVSALAFDANGKLHVLNPGTCSAAGKEYRLGATLERTATTGVCPFGLAFTDLPSVD